MVFNSDPDILKLYFIFYWIVHKVQKYEKNNDIRNDDEKLASKSSILIHLIKVAISSVSIIIIIIIIIIINEYYLGAVKSKNC